MSKADLLKKKMENSPSFTSRESVIVKPLPELAPSIEPTTVEEVTPALASKKVAAPKAKKQEVVTDTPKAYSTSLTQDYKNKIRRYAFFMELKEREVVENALTDYFAKHASKVQ